MFYISGFAEGAAHFG